MQWTMWSLCQLYINYGFSLLKLIYLKDLDTSSLILVWTNSIQTLIVKIAHQSIINLRIWNSLFIINK